MTLKAPKPPGRPPITLADWRNDPEAERVPRRWEVFAVLRWYHENVVMPQLGFRAALARVWWRLRARFDPNPGKRHAIRIRLMSPWEQLAYRDWQRMVEAEREAELELYRLRERQQQDPGGSTP